MILNHLEFFLFSVNFLNYNTLQLCRKIKEEFNMSTMEVIKMLMPLLIIEGILKIFCLFKLSKDQVKYLPKLAWGFIILLISAFGPLAYLFLGRKRY